MKKRLLSMIMALAMVLTMLPVETQAAGTGSLQYRWALWNNTTNRMEEDTTARLNSEFNTEPGGSPVFFYYVDANGKETRLSASDLKSSDEKIVKLEDNDEAPDMVHVDFVGFGQTTISYTTGGQTYHVDVTVSLPEIGFYTGTTASESTHLQEFTVTDTQNTFYLVARNGWSLTSVTPVDDLANIAKVTIAPGGAYATVVVDGTPANGRGYNVEVDATNATTQDSWSGYWVGLRLQNGKPYLGYRNPNWNNGVPSEDLNNSLQQELYGAVGFDNDFYFYFVENGVEKRLSAADLKSSDENIVTVSRHESDNKLTSLSFEDFGTVTMSYTTGGKTYSMEITAGLPDFGFYTTTTASQSTYVREFKVTESADTFYFVPRAGWKLTRAVLDGDFANIAKMDVAADGSYAKITVTGVPNSDRWYGVEFDAYKAEDNRTRTNNGESLKLVNGKPALMFRYAGFDNNGPVEDKTNWLQNGIFIAKGYNEPTTFYYVVDGVETKLAPDDLKSSNEDVVKVTYYDTKEIIVLESVDFGQADITYTKGGKTYGVSVTVGLPQAGAYSATAVSQSSYLVEKDITETDDTFYILMRDGEKILNVELLDDLAKIANVQVDPSGNYAAVKVTGMPAGWNYNFKVTFQDQNQSPTEYWGSITLNNKKPTLAFCWPEDTPSGHGDFYYTLDTAKGFSTDLWVYLVEGSKETKIALEDLKSSDESVLKVTRHPGSHGMVRLQTVGWGNATVSYTKGNKTYSFDIISDTLDYGYYTKPVISRENWVTDFKVTETDNVLYFMAKDNMEFIELKPTDELLKIAKISLSADKSYATVTITGTPEENGWYGIEFKAAHPGGWVNEGNHSINLINGLPVKVVTPVIEQTAAQIAENTVADLVADIAKGDVKEAEKVMSKEVVEKIETALQAGKTITTEVIANALTKEEVAASAPADLQKIEATIKNGEKIARYLDLSVIIKAVDASGDEEVLGTLDQVGQKMKFTLLLPKDLQAADHVFYVIRVHDGKADRLKTQKNADGSISFETDRYSTYALVYEKVQTNVGSGSGSDGAQAVGSPKTGDMANVALWVTLLVTGAAVLSMAVLGKKKKVGAGRSF